jgi:membrane associated rhomboid family serine protease
MNAEPKKAEASNEMKGIWVALWVIAWFAAILFAFFFIGAVVGVAAVIGGAVVSLLVAFRFLRRESTERG